MFKFLRKHQTFLFATLAVIIFALPFFGLGGMAFFSAKDRIATLNGKKITQRQFDQIYQNLLRQKESLNADQQKQLFQEALQELIQQEAFYQEAQKYGITVPDQEIQLQILNTPSFQREGKFDYGTYARTVTQVFRMSPEEFEEIRRRDSAGMQLRQLIISSVHISHDVVQAGLPNRIAIETDAKKKKELQNNPDVFREELRQKEIGKVFNDWLAQMNRTLKFDPSPSLRAQLAGK